MEMEMEMEMEEQQKQQKQAVDTNNVAGGDRRSRGCTQSGLRVLASLSLLPGGDDGGHAAQPRRLAAVARVDCLLLYLWAYHVTQNLTAGSGAAAGVA
uniref:Uncharacterized protein n=1 Tax=Oryza brachyantha TaxID=4533 RepID=J3L1V8_ORYBR